MASEKFFLFLKTTSHSLPEFCLFTQDNDKVECTVSVGRRFLYPDKHDAQSDSRLRRDTKNAGRELTVQIMTLLKNNDQAATWNYAHNDRTHLQAIQTAFC